MTAIVESELAYDEKFFLLFFATKLNFKGDLFKQEISISYKIASDKMGCSKRHIILSIKKTLELGYIKVKKENKYGKNLINKYLLTKKILDEYQKKIERLSKKEEKIVEHWHRILAQKWVTWLQDEMGVRVDSVEELAFHLFDASVLLKSTESYKKPIENLEAAMEIVFDFIQIHETHWKNAAMLPEHLLIKKNGVARVRVIYNQATENPRNAADIKNKRITEQMKKDGEEEIKY